MTEEPPLLSELPDDALRAWAQQIREASDARHEVYARVWREEQARRTAERQARLDVWLEGDVTVPRRVLYDLHQRASENYDGDLYDEDEDNPMRKSYQALIVDGAKPWPS